MVIRGTPPIPPPWKALYVKERLLEEIKGQPFCFHFDETTNAQLKKQYDAYIAYYSSSRQLITTSYTGSLFVGHCTATDLLNHFLMFVKELGLNTVYLLNIGMDGPRVNKKFEAELKVEL